MAELSIVERFRESHHAVARMFAAGMTMSMVRQRTGYSHHRLSILWADPTFQELIKYYSDKIEKDWETNLNTYLDLGMSNMIRAEAQIAERLDDAEVNNEPIPLTILNRISQGRADRFGYGKNSTVNVNVDFASALDRAIDRSGVKTIEARPVTSSQTALPPPRPEQEYRPLPDTPAREPMPYEAPRRAFASVLAPRKFGRSVA